MAEMICWTVLTNGTKSHPPRLSLWGEETLEPFDLRNPLSGFEGEWGHRSHAALLYIHTKQF